MGKKRIVTASITLYVKDPVTFNMKFETSKCEGTIRNRIRYRLAPLIALRMYPDRYHPGYILSKFTEHLNLGDDISILRDEDVKITLIKGDTLGSYKVFDATEIFAQVNMGKRGEELDEPTINAEDSEARSDNESYSEEEHVELNDKGIPKEMEDLFEKIAEHAKNAIIEHVKAEKKIRRNKAIIKWIKISLATILVIGGSIYLGTIL